MERLLDELRRIQEVVLLYPPQGESGPPRAATVLSTQTLPQQALVKTLGLDQLHQPTVGKTTSRRNALSSTELLPSATALAVNSR